MSEPNASTPAPVDDEPQTPMWLPALGAALFVSAGLYWAVTPSAPPPTDADTAASASAAAPPPAPPPGAAQVRPAQPVQVPPQLQGNPGGAAAGVRGIPSNLPPDLQQRLQQMRNNPHP